MPSTSFIDQLGMSESFNFFYSDSPQPTDRDSYNNTQDNTFNPVVHLQPQSILSEATLAELKSLQETELTILLSSHHPTEDPSTVQRRIFRIQNASTIQTYFPSYEKIPDLLESHISYDFCRSVSTSYDDMTINLSPITSDILYKSSTEYGSPINLERETNQQFDTAEHRRPSVTSAYPITLSPIYPYTFNYTEKLRLNRNRKKLTRHAQIWQQLEQLICQYFDTNPIDGVHTNPRDTTIAGRRNYRKAQTYGHFNTSISINEKLKVLLEDMWSEDPSMVFSFVLMVLTSIIRTSKQRMLTTANPLPEGSFLQPNRKYIFSLSPPYQTLHSLFHQTAFSSQNPLQSLDTLDQMTTISRQKDGNLQWPVLKRLTGIQHEDEAASSSPSPSRLGVSNGNSLDAVDSLALSMLERVEKLWNSIRPKVEALAEFIDPLIAREERVKHFGTGFDEYYRLLYQSEENHEATKYNAWDIPGEIPLRIGWIFRMLFRSVILRDHCIRWNIRRGSTILKHISSLDSNGDVQQLLRLMEFEQDVWMMDQNTEKWKIRFALHLIATRQAGSNPDEQVFFNSVVLHPLKLACLARHIRYFWSEYFAAQHPTLDQSPILQPYHMGRLCRKYVSSIYDKMYCELMKNYAAAIFENPSGLQQHNTSKKAKPAIKALRNGFFPITIVPSPPLPSNQIQQLVRCATRGLDHPFRLRHGRSAPFLSILANFSESDLEYPSSINEALSTRDLEEAFSDNSDADYQSDTSETSLLVPGYEAYLKAIHAMEKAGIPQTQIIDWASNGAQYLHLLLSCQTREEAAAILVEKLGPEVEPISSEILDLILSTDTARSANGSEMMDAAEMIVDFNNAKFTSPFGPHGKGALKIPQAPPSITYDLTEEDVDPDVDSNQFGYPENLVASMHPNQRIPRDRAYLESLPPDAFQLDDQHMHHPRPPGRQKRKSALPPPPALNDQRVSVDELLEYIEGTGSKDKVSKKAKGAKDESPQSNPSIFNAAVSANSSTMVQAKNGKKLKKQPLPDNGLPSVVQEHKIPTEFPEFWQPDQSIDPLILNEIVSDANQFAELIEVQILEAQKSLQGRPLPATAAAKVAASKKKTSKSPAPQNESTTIKPAPTHQMSANIFQSIQSKSSRDPRNTVLKAKAEFDKFKIAATAKSAASSSKKSKK